MKLFRIFAIGCALGISLFWSAVCTKDNAAMRAENEKMKATLAEVINRQLQQEAAVRQVKTDAEIVYRIATSGEFLEERK